MLENETTHPFKQSKGLLEKVKFEDLLTCMFFPALHGFSYAYPADALLEISLHSLPLYKLHSRVVHEVFDENSSCKWLKNVYHINCTGKKEREKHTINKHYTTTLIIQSKEHFREIFIWYLFENV